MFANHTPVFLKHFNLQPSKIKDNSLRLQTIPGIENDLICIKYMKTKIIIDDVKRNICLFILRSLAIDVNVLIRQNFRGLDDIEYYKIS